MKLYSKKIANNLVKVDVSPNGIFFFSYSTPIAYIKGKEELVCATKLSATTSKHIKKLEGVEIARNAEKVDLSVLEALAKKAGIPNGII